MQDKLPIRKHPRLKEYDYSKAGYYFTTINTKNNLPILSNVETEYINEIETHTPVGRGLAPAEKNVRLTTAGEIIKEQLISLEDRYNYTIVQKYVIMPTHIHAIISIENETAGASPRPTIADIICAFKSLTTRLCNTKDEIKGRKIWQASFYDHIIRNEQEYLKIWNYIDTNPAKWEDDEYYTMSAL